MQFMNSWATEDRRVLLHFADPTLKVFHQYIQAHDTGNEAGGLLLGTVHGVNMLITEATIPTAWDKRFRYFFERLPFGHIAIAQARWLDSKGTVRYLGEWHTHPQDYPRPSSLDRSEWSSLSAKRKDKRPMLAVIVGRQGLYVELVHQFANPSVMSPVE